MREHGPQGPERGSAMSSQRWNRMPELVGKDLKKAKGEEGAGSKSFMEASTDSSLHRVLPLWAAPQSVGLT